MIYLTLHLHAYQPPTQPKEMVEKICRESYEPIVRLAETNRSVFFSFDIARSLAERLPKEFLERIRNLYLAQRVELVNTAAYHYLLPLVPREITLRQLELNEELYRAYIIGNDPLPGVFLPELACSPLLPAMLKEAGYRWFIADDGPLAMRDIHIPPEERIPQDWIPEYDKCGVILRSRMWSERIARGEYSDGKQFFHDLLEGHRSWRIARRNFRESYLILAVDAETFGHHQKDAIEKFLVPLFEEVAQRPRICQLATLDFIFRRFRKIAPAQPLPAGSWSTKDTSIPFPLWNDPKNRFHKLWNAFAAHAFALLPPYHENLELQTLLDIAFYSCTPWQFSRGNKNIARWCLPYFQRIIELFPVKEAKPQLGELYQEMERLTR